MFFVITKPEFNEIAKDCVEYNFGNPLTKLNHNDIRCNKVKQNVLSYKCHVCYLQTKLLMQMIADFVSLK